MFRCRVAYGDRPHSQLPGCSRSHTPRGWAWVQNLDLLDGSSTNHIYLVVHILMKIYSWDTLYVYSYICSRFQSSPKKPWKSTRWGPRTIAFSWFISTITFGFMILITIVHGVYKPTNITGGPHLVDMHKGLSTSHPLNQITIIGEMGAS